MELTEFFKHLSKYQDRTRQSAPQWQNTSSADSSFGERVNIMLSMDLIERIEKIEAVLFADGAPEHEGEAKKKGVKFW